MRKLSVINTGGTFNKRYNPVEGSLDVVKDGSILETFMEKWLCEFEVLNLIGKDSLDITTNDRMELLATINMSEYDDFVVIHGTDTMELTARYLAEAELEKRIVLTGAMIPYSIDASEASANLASAIGYIQLLTDDGVYIAMNGVMGRYDKVIKDRTAGRFVLL